MNQVIIYPHDGGVAIVTPTQEWLTEEGNTMEKLAEQTVPPGTSWKIVNSSDIPTDRTFRDAWEYQE